MIFKTQSPFFGGRKGHRGRNVPFPQARAADAPVTRVTVKNSGLTNSTNTCQMEVVPAQAIIT